MHIILNYWNKIRTQKTNTNLVESRRWQKEIGIGSKCATLFFFIDFFPQRSRYIYIFRVQQFALSVLEHLCCVYILNNHVIIANIILSLSWSVWKSTASGMKSCNCRHCFVVIIFIKKTVVRIILLIIFFICLCLDFCIQKVWKKHQLKWFLYKYFAKLKFLLFSIF